MLAKYGIRGIFLAGKPWRWVMFSLVLIYSLSSGFRGQTILYALILAIMFYLEGLHRTKLLPILVFIGISTAALTIPLITHLPYSFQRSLAFLPLNFDPAVQEDARKSWEWRVDMWKALMPQIPPHLLLGKGYAMSQLDIALLTGPDAAVRPGESFVENQFLSLSGAYHNGPLSIVLTFGIWGCIAMAWFWTVSMRVLYRNYRYGDPALRTVNMLLMVTFGSRILIFSSLDVDMLSYCGLLGLSVSLNGEACRPAPEPVRETDKLQAFDAVRSRLRPAFQHSKTQA
jgi:hypothetical protein